MAFLLLQIFGSATSLAAGWAAFCALPELSKIGAITVAVFLGSLIGGTISNFVTWSSVQFARLRSPVTPPVAPTDASVIEADN
jgi:hypothetical protein